MVNRQALFKKARSLSILYKEKLKDLSRQIADKEVALAELAQLLLPSPQSLSSVKVVTYCRIQVNMSSDKDLKLRYQQALIKEVENLSDSEFE